MSYRVQNGDCRIELPLLADCSVDSVVTDPPYELGFMGKVWDRSGIAYQVEVWRECLRVLKPGGHLLAFGGSRTYHRLACAIEDAGFEIRDDIDFWYDANPIFAAFYDSLSDEQKETLHQSAGASHLSWVYGSGFPKSLDVSKAIDASAGVERETTPRVRVDGKATGNGGATFMSGSTVDVDRPYAVTDAAKQWNGWGTALKPAHEPIVLARKPLIGTVAENVLQHGTGGLNIDGCRIGIEPNDDIYAKNPHTVGTIGANGIYSEGSPTLYEIGKGRWPANVIHDGSEEVLAGFPDVGSGVAVGRNASVNLYNGWIGEKGSDTLGYNDSGSAARFFYCAKASREDREDGLEGLPLRQRAEKEGRDNVLNSKRDLRYEDRPNSITPPARNHHPTVKPTDLMRYLCRLVTPPNGTVLDPFCGSGSTGRGAVLEGFNFIGIELDAEYCAIAEKRIEAVTRQGILTFA